MTDNFEITSADVATLSLSKIHPLVGVEDGAIVVSPHGNKEQVVYEYDDEANFIGWHKQHLGEVS